MKRPDVDMSPKAIDRRLREGSDLRDLCLELAKAKYVGPADPEAAAKVHAGQGQGLRPARPLRSTRSEA